jgi:predicted transcriptional regulator
MSPRDKAADLTLRETAAALGLSVGTVRAHIRAGRLHATQVVAKHGPEYRLRPAVVAAFGAERLGLELDAAALGTPAPSAAAGEDVRELYERLLLATEEATRYRALSAAGEAHHADEVARLQAERDEARAELAAERARPWWRRRRKASE